MILYCAICCGCLLLIVLVLRKVMIENSVCTSMYLYKMPLVNSKCWKSLKTWVEAITKWKLNKKCFKMIILKCYTNNVFKMFKNKVNTAVNTRYLRYYKNLSNACLANYIINAHLLCYKECCVSCITSMCKSEYLALLVVNLWLFLSCSDVMSGSYDNCCLVDQLPSLYFKLEVLNENNANYLFSFSFSSVQFSFSSSNIQYRKQQSNWKSVCWFFFN